jgi:HTH-type transcriptional regulator, transcriptional repressor of NAD biosynthesis genes
MSGGTPHRLVVIGAESTGKTELAGWLSAQLGVFWSEEHARSYAERRGGGHLLVREDVEPIARGQLSGEEAVVARAAEAGHALVVHDTDLLSTAVYAELYYGAGSIPPWLRTAAHERTPALYLLCDTDIPWMGDGVRDGVIDREAMRRAFSAAVGAQDAPVVPITGSREERRATALAAASRLLRGDRRPYIGPGPDLDDQ